MECTKVAPINQHQDQKQPDYLRGNAFKVFDNDDVFLIARIETLFNMVAVQHNKTFKMQLAMYDERYSLATAIENVKEVDCHISCRKVRKTLNLNFNRSPRFLLIFLKGKSFTVPALKMTYKIIHRHITDDRKPGYCNSEEFRTGWKQK